MLKQYVHNEWIAFCLQPMTTNPSCVEKYVICTFCRLYTNQLCSWPNIKSSLKFTAHTFSPDNFGTKWPTIHMFRPMPRKLVLIDNESKSLQVTFSRNKLRNNDLLIC